MDINLEPLINSRKVILFDLDGTLMDSFSAVLNTMLSAIQANGFQPPEDFSFASIWGKSEDEVLRDIGIPEQYIPQIREEWNRLDEETGKEISLYDGIPQLLRTLQENGCMLGVVTGRSDQKTRVVPAAQALKNHLDVYVTPDDTSRGKPYPDQIFFALEKLGAVPSQTIFIGDSIVDITAAFLADCKSILVTWGGAKDASGFPHQPDYVVSTVDELKQLLLG